MRLSVGTDTKRKQEKHVIAEFDGAKAKEGFF